MYEDSSPQVGVLENLDNLQAVPLEDPSEPKKKPPNEEVQKRAIAHVKKVFDEYDQLLKGYRALWAEIFKATYVFETDRNSPGQSTIFFPKCFEQVEKIAPRLTLHKPKFVIGLNTPVHPERPETDMLASADEAQRSLNFYWKFGGNQKKFRTWAKGGLLNGVMFAEAELETVMRKKKKSEIVNNEKGEAVEKITEKEEVFMEYPTFSVPDIFDMYFDPRIDCVDDMYALIKNKDQVKMVDILNNEDIYFNLDKVKALSPGAFSSNEDNQKMNKFTLQGISMIDDGKSECYANFKKYYGYFSETGKPEDEELILITTVADSICIQYEPISFLPYEMFVPIEIPNQGVGKGVVEPVKKLQDAYNLTRNQRFENVSMVINRMWLMKLGAGIDPRKLYSRAGHIVVTKDMDALKPMETPDVTASAFNEANALNTEIQTTLGTIDTTQESNDNGFTNLATGQKIRWNEYNTRFKAIRQNLEESLSRLGEKMLRMVGERSTKNPVVQDLNNRRFYEIAREVFDSVSDFYDVSVLANSTAADSIEDARDEALAKFQLYITAKAQGLSVNLKEKFKEVMETFPGEDVTNIYEEVPQAIEQPGNGRPMSEKVLEQARVQPSDDQALNEQLANV